MNHKRNKKYNQFHEQWNVQIKKSIFRQHWFTWIYEWLGWELLTNIYKLTEFYYWAFPTRAQQKCKLTTIDDVHIETFKSPKKLWCIRMLLQAIQNRTCIEHARLLTSWFAVVNRFDGLKIDFSGSWLIYGTSWWTIDSFESTANLIVMFLSTIVIFCCCLECFSIESNKK